MPNRTLKLVPTAKLRIKSIENTSLPVPGYESWHVCATDPALSVMTDFRSRSSVTVPETASLDEAIEHMKHTGVRCAFVVEKKNNVVIGMITAYDILGEKPQQFMHFSSTKHVDVLVKDIMTRIKDWPTANIEDIEQSNVGDVLEALMETTVTHLPVMETTESGEPRLRGLLSFAKLKRLLVDIA